MMQFEFNVIRAGDVRRVASAIKKAQKTIGSIIRMLHEDIVLHRLNKPRTGPWRKIAKGWKHRTKINKYTGEKMKTIAGRNYKRMRESGPPMYPQVLSIDNGQLHRNVFALLVERGDDTVGRVGTNVKYGIIWELRGPGEGRSAMAWGGRSRGAAFRSHNVRAWLRPALADNYDRIMAEFGINLRAGLAELVVEGSK